MSIKKTLLATSLLLSLGFVGAANAETLSDSVTINFSGAFQDSTCDVTLNNTDVKGNGKVDVYLGTYTVNSLKTEGEATDAKPLTVKFSNCGAIPGANITFAGTQTTSKLFDVDGTNKNNVGVGINTAAESTDYLAIGDATPVKFSDAAGESTFYARFVKIGSEAIVGGTENATATMNISYN